MPWRPAVKLGSFWVASTHLSELQYCVLVVLGLESVSTVYEMLKRTVLQDVLGTSVKTK